MKKDIETPYSFSFFLYVNGNDKNRRLFELIRIAAVTLLISLCCLWFVHAEATTPETFAYGHVDRITVAEDSFEIQGWAAASIPSERTATISIRFGTATIYEGRFERLERPDVVNATGRSDWLRSGWRVVGPMPPLFRSGSYPVRVQIKLDSGHVVDLPRAREAEKVTFNRSSYLFQKISAWMVLISLCGLAIVAFLHIESIAKRLTTALHMRISEWAVAAAALLFIFVAFVLVGFTGSSLAIGIKSTSYIEADLPVILGKSKPIRSDEWAVFTPLAIAQVNHSPQFPIVNKNLGSDGQNMLIVGMAGVPVQHISAFAKPATWGFHFFDLKRAMAWYWWFPIFGCLFALWGAFCILARGHWRLGLVTALSFCLSPYVIAWSQWPAYTVFFPSVAFCCTAFLLRAEKTITLVSLSLMLGLAVAGFILILYPPSQIPIAYLYALMTVGVVLRDRLYSNFNLAKLLAFGGASAVAGGIIGKWWVDSESAITAMLNTVYPGQRNMVVGGTVVLPDLLRGFTNILTLYKLDGDYTNHSEIASFFYYFLPALFLASVLVVKRKLELVAWLILGFIIWTLVFMLHGFPHWLAKLTLWGRVPASRADLALGLAFILLCGLLLSIYKREGLTLNPWKKVAAVVISLGWTVIVFFAMYKFPSGVLSGISPGVAAGLFVVISLSGIWLALGCVRRYFILTLTFTAAGTLAFNPLVIAPSKLTVSPSIHEIVFSSTQENKGYRRVLVLETHIPAIMLFAGGIPVANGVFYYPQKTLWSNLDPNSKELNVYNRYQHLFFTSGDVDANNGFRLESPQADVVRVTINLKSFDFKLSGAEILAAPIGDKPLLEKNKSVKFIKRTGEWGWFQIVAD